MGNLLFMFFICLAVAIVSIVLTVKVFIPTSTIKIGDELHIYIGSKYNRTATVNEINESDDVIVIYDNFPLPYTYQGRFYAIGYMSDGNKLIFIKNKKLLIPALLAELIRF